MVSIRLGTHEDLVSIVKINKVIDYDNPVEFMEETIGAERLFVAEMKDESEPVGFGMYQVLWGNTPIVSLLKVLPEYQRQGIGSKMLKAIESHLVERGFEFLLSSKEAVNSLSQDFHLKHGFRPIGSLQMPHGQEDYLQKNLSK